MRVLAFLLFATVILLGCAGDSAQTPIDTESVFRGSVSNVGEHGLGQIVLRTGTKRQLLISFLEGGTAQVVHAVPVVEWQSDRLHVTAELPALGMVTLDGDIVGNEYRFDMQAEGRTSSGVAKQVPRADSRSKVASPTRGDEWYIGDFTLQVLAGTSAKGLFKYAGGTGTLTTQNPKTLGYQDTSFDVVNTTNMAFSELNVNGNGQMCADLLVMNWSANINGTQFWGMYTQYSDHSQTMEYIVERDISSSLGTLDFTDTLTSVAYLRYKINDGSGDGE
jgi:hypothetical protein